jgi:hypothetical protein
VGWFIMMYTGLHPLADGKYHGPFYGSVASARVLQLSTRHPSESSDIALTIWVWNGGSWTDIDSVPDA